MNDRVEVEGPDIAQAEAAGWHEPAATLAALLAEQIADQRAYARVAQARVLAPMTAPPTCGRCGRHAPRGICCCRRWPHLFPAHHQPAPQPAQGSLFEETAR